MSLSNKANISLDKTHGDESNQPVSVSNPPSHLKKYALAYVIATLASIVLIWLSLGVGFGEWNNPFNLDDTIWQLRYPRVVSALLVGMALSVSGAALQALFENPLADPSLIGTSGGAALGVVLVLALGIGGIGVPFAAFIGSLIVCIFISRGARGSRTRAGR